MRFEREQLLDLREALRRTWIATDGAGALAAGSALGCPTSRWHGLLLAPAPGTSGLHAFLSRLEDWVFEGERALPLASACYPGALHPGGHTFLSSFATEPAPTWRYLVGDVTVERSVRLLRPARRASGGGHGVLVRWSLEGPGGAARRLVVRPLFACRDAGQLTFENAHADRRVEVFEGGVLVRPYPALPAVTLSVAVRRRGASAGGAQPVRFRPEAAWFRRIEYPLDVDAGLPAHEDHLTPGEFEVQVGARAEVVLAATTGPWVADPLAAWSEACGPSRRSRGPRARAAGGFTGGSTGDVARWLERAAEDHLVRRGGADGPVEVLERLPGADVSDLVRWQALPGLLLCRGQVGAFMATLTDHAQRVAEGGAAVDGLASSALGAQREAALAWARCVELLAATPAGRGPRFAALEAAAFALGGRLRREAEGDAEAGGSGLLSGAAAAGPRRLDAAVNARWVAFAAWLAGRRGSGRTAPRRGWSDTTRALSSAFRERFWQAQEQALAHAWHDGAADRSFRPSAVAAVAEAFSPLEAAERAAVLARATAELLTTRGLRTLSPRDPLYGPQAPARVGPRGATPPQGCVEVRWLEPYVEARLRLAPRGAARVRAELAPLLLPGPEVLGEHGLDRVAEAYDGDPPHAAGGAPSAALAVAALLRGRALLRAGRR